MDRIKHLENKYSVARYELMQECEGDELRFYLYLKLYAINSHEAFPSYTTISKDLNWNIRKIPKIINRMVKRGRLKVGKVERTVFGTRQVHNVYDISWYDALNNQGSIEYCQDGITSTAKAVMELKTLTKTETLPLTENKKQEQKQKQVSVTVPVPAVDQSLIKRCIALFKGVNPSFERLFSNTTERAAMARLLDKYGAQKVENMINWLPKIAGQPFAPVIMTPWELEIKLGKLMMFLKKVADEKPKYVKIR